MVSVVWGSLLQNCRQKVFDKGTLRLRMGIDILKFDKISTDL